MGTRSSAIGLFTVSKRFCVGLVALSSVLALLNVQVANAATQLRVVADRGTFTPTIPENTAQAFEAGAPYSDELETDVRFTRNPAGAAGPTMVLIHDATLDRTTNCTGYVKDQYWSYIRDHCRTDIGSQPIMKLTDLVSFAKTNGKQLDLEIKDGNISDRRAQQFYNAVKSTPKVQVAALPGGPMSSLKAVRAIDAADPLHRLRYVYMAYASAPPSVATVKSVGTTIWIEKTVSASKVAAYRAAGLRVVLFTGRNESDYAMMMAKAPTGVIVADPQGFQAWYGGL